MQQDSVSETFGGRAGWFRIAGGLTALQAFFTALSALNLAGAPGWVRFPHRSLVVAALCVSVLLLVRAILLALRGDRRAGLWMLLGYFVSASAEYWLAGIEIGPSVLLVASMLALVVASRRSPLAAAQSDA